MENKTLQYSGNKLAENHMMVHEESPPVLQHHFDFFFVTSFPFFSGKSLLLGARTSGAFLAF